MRLADYISENTKAILSDWESFVRGSNNSAGLAMVALRDYAEELLTITAQDLASGLTQACKSDKLLDDCPGRGRIDELSKPPGTENFTSGLQLLEVLAGCSSLRATVLYLFGKHKLKYDCKDLEDIALFDNSIDQLLSVAMSSFSNRINHAQQLFISELSHDLRNHLNTIKLGATVLTLKGEMTEGSETVVSQMVASSETVDRMVRDLGDFLGSALGTPPTLERMTTSLRSLCQEVVEEFKTTHPDVVVKFEPSGDFLGEWDVVRLRQVISHLLNNLVLRGGREQPIELILAEQGSEFLLSASNQGPPIPPNELATIFDPFTQAGPNQSQGVKYKGSMWLGLYIIKEVIDLHGGSVEVQSSEQGKTVFSVRLPRNAEESYTIV